MIKIHYKIGIGLVIVMVKGTVMVLVLVKVKLMVQVMVKSMVKVMMMVRFQRSQPTRDGTVWQLQMPANRDQLLS